MAGAIGRGGLIVQSSCHARTAIAGVSVLSVWLAGCLLGWRQKSVMTPCVALLTLHAPSGEPIHHRCAVEPVGAASPTRRVYTRHLLCACCRWCFIRNHTSWVIILPVVRMDHSQSRPCDGVPSLSVSSVPAGSEMWGKLMVLVNHRLIDSHILMTNIYFSSPARPAART